MFTVILIGALIAYLVTGFWISRNYHARRAIAWEERYAKCDRCITSPDRKHHNLCHDSRAKYQTMSIFLVPFWPMLAPITAGKGIGTLYMQPLKQWEANQEELLRQREFYQNELARLSTSSEDYKIYKDALQGIDSQIIRKK